MSKKTNLVFTIAKLMNCEGEGSDDTILEIQKQMKYLKIKWAVLKWKMIGECWSKPLMRRLKLQNACKSECLLKWYAYWLSDAEGLSH